MKTSQFLTMLTKLQKLLGHGTTEFAAYIGINRTTLTKWLTKKSVPSVERMDNVLTTLRTRAVALDKESQSIFSVIPEQSVF